jgi:hypothetical protein
MEAVNCGQLKMRIMNQRIWGQVCAVLVLCTRPAKKYTDS